MKLNGIWWLLVALAGAFSLLYIWSTLFPGKVNPAALEYFSPGQVDQGRAYSTIPRLLFITSFVLQVAFILYLLLSGKALALSRWTQQVTGGSLWSFLLFFLVLWLALRLIRLPFSFYTGYVWQHRWGFSTQSMSSWWADYIKGAGLEMLLAAVGVALLFWIMGRRPENWWLVVASLVSLWLLVQTFIWPVLVSPMFNRFEAARDTEIVAMVQELGQKAGIPVSQVLIMDASKRTTKANAYFTGLGHTKRIVLYDNLVNRYPMDEVKAVVAHEMAHWKQGHIVKGLALGIGGNFILWPALFVLLRFTLPGHALYQPQTWALILLFFMLVSFNSGPLQNHISRNMEREADRVSVMLTEDVEAATRLEVSLAAKNLSDVSPPPFIQWFSYSHPPAPERIRIIQQAASALSPR